MLGTRVCGKRIITTVPVTCDLLIDEVNSDFVEKHEDEQAIAETISKSPEKP